MEELIDVLKDIKQELSKMNDKLDEIKGEGPENSLSNIHERLERIENKMALL